MFQRNAQKGLNPLLVQKEHRCNAQFVSRINIGLFAVRSLSLAQCQIVISAVSVERQIIIIISVHAKQDLRPT